MREYETTFVVQPEISDEGGKAILGKAVGEIAIASVPAGDLQLEIIEINY